MTPEPIGIAAVLADITKRFETAAKPKTNLSGGVESRNAELPCKHGDLSKGSLMPSAHKLVRENNGSRTSARPAQKPQPDWRDKEEEWMN